DYGAYHAGNAVWLEVCVLGNKESRQEWSRKYMNTATVNRRDFLSAVSGGCVALALSRPVLPSNPTPIRITEAKFLRLRYPGSVPRRRNATIESGGGAPGMTQLELHTDAGIIGRSIPAGSPEIITQQLMPRI